PPVASIRDHIANGPGAIVDGKVFYVTDIAVERGEVVPGHIADASELGVALRCPLARGHLRRHWVYRWRRRRNAWVREESPPIWPRPVIRIAVVARQFDLLLAIDWLVGVDRWAPLHLVSTERDRDAVSGRAANGDRRDEHLTSRKPGPRVDHQVPHGPRPVVEVEILHAADVTVGRCDSDSFELASRPQHCRLLSDARCCAPPAMSSASAGPPTVLENSP